MPADDLKQLCIDVRLAAAEILAHARISQADPPYNPLTRAQVEKQARAIEDAFRLNRLRRAGVSLRTITCKAPECRTQFNVPALNGQYACPKCPAVMELSFHDGNISEIIKKA